MPSFREVLARLYGAFAIDDGSLAVLLRVPQIQKGTDDCGLFAIANAVALAQRMNLTKVNELTN